MRGRVNIDQSPAPLERWPDVNDALMSSDDATLFRARKKAMELYFVNESIAEIERITGVCRTSLGRMARKCLGMANDGRIFGFRALIPYLRTQKNQRTSPFQDKRQHQQGGQAGALRALLDKFPDIERTLNDKLLQASKVRKVYAHSIEAQSLHRIFLQCVREKNLGQSDWPFNTKHLGKRSIQKYMKDVLDRNFAKSVLLQKDSVAKAHLAVGTGHGTLLKFQDPYDAVEIDAYKMDASMTVAFQNPGGTETDVPLDRIWLIAMVDRASTAILSYKVVFRSEVSSNDVVRVISDSVTCRWTPMKLGFSMQYGLDAGLPSGVISGADGACWSLAFFDGALAHLAEAIHENVRKTLGFSITWGAAGHFERRPNVERTFRKIADQVFKRLPSTTGANPFNGRAKDPGKKAVRYRIRADEVQQVLDVFIAQHNATSTEGLYNLTPLDHIKSFIENSEFPLMLRKVPCHAKEKARRILTTSEATVRGDRKGGRRPYIQIDRVRYTSPHFSELGHLIGSKVIIEVDEEDMRQIKIFLQSGGELGFLTAQGKWSQTRHSRTTRKAINSAVNKRIISMSEMEDPVEAYMAHLSKTQRAKPGKAVISPRQATEATRLAQESGLPLKLVVSKEDSLPPESEIRRLTEAPRSLFAVPEPVQRKVKVKNHS